MFQFSTNSQGKSTKEPFDFQKFMEHFESFKHTKKEREQMDKLERREKEGMFLSTLAWMAREQFGIGYTGKHKRNAAACGLTIQSHILSLLQTGMGACYTGCKGSGKTNILLEYFLILNHRLWIERVKNQDYPNPQQFIEKTVRFSYALNICKAFKSGEKVLLAKYNLIDDLGVECPPDYVMAEFDGYFEEINRLDLKLVVSTNSEKEALEHQERYIRIYSRMKEKCRFYELPLIDYRDPKNWDKI